MKQKIIIGFSVALLLLAVFLIARDLFRNSPSFTATSCCGDEFASLKQIDTALLGYTRIRAFDTNVKDLTGITVNEDQQIFVCGNRQVVLYDSTGNRTGGFSIDSMANCIALNGNHIYVGMGSRIAHYDFSGKLMNIWKPYSTEGYITSITANEDYVYAADAFNKRILKYSAEGNLIQVIGKKDSVTGTPGFVIPSYYFDIAFGGFNDLWVVNPGRLRVENYTMSGNMRSAWGKASFEDNGFTGCCNPAHMAILPDGSFVTYEKGIDKIKVFDPAGRFHCMVAGAGSFKGNTDFQLGNNNLVKDIAADIPGNIYVLDAYNRISVFKKKNS
jgi:hypothetical protein